MVSEVAQLLATATSKDDCGRMQRINSRSLTTFDCPASRALRKSMAKFEILAAETFGSGAVIDYRSGQAEDGASIVAFADPGGRWGIGRFGILTTRNVGSSDAKSRSGFDKAVAGYLEAVTSRDCRAFQDYAVTGSRDPKVVCDRQLGATAGLARRLKANPGAVPSYLGGNATFGFYSIETRKPKPAGTTIAVITAPSGSAQPYLVLDVAASPVGQTDDSVAPVPPTNDHAPDHNGSQRSAEVLAGGTG